MSVAGHAVDGAAQLHRAEAAVGGDAGCTTVICSDKTGTLTTNEMCVVTLLSLDKDGRAVAHAVEGISYNPEGRIEGIDRYDLSGCGERL